MAEPHRDPEALVPLTPSVYHILLALADGAQHGYAIMKDVEARSGGRVLLSTGTLYAAIKRLLDGGLIEETADRPAAVNDDQRRRYYVLTPFGREVARAETRRMADLVGIARRKKLASGPPAGSGDGSGQ